MEVAFNSIAFHAALILNKLRNEAALRPEKQDADKHPEKDRDAAEEQRDKSQRDFVSHRVREIEAFERRARFGRKK